MGKEDDVLCVGGYADERDFAMNYGNVGERPEADNNIALVPIPQIDPVFGNNYIPSFWNL